MSGAIPVAKPVPKPVAAEPGGVVNLVATATGFTIASVAVGSANKENA